MSDGQSHYISFVEVTAQRIRNNRADLNPCHPLSSSDETYAMKVTHYTDPKMLHIKKEYD